MSAKKGIVLESEKSGSQIVIILNYAKAQGAGPSLLVNSRQLLSGSLQYV